MTNTSMSSDLCISSSNRTCSYGKKQPNSRQWSKTKNKAQRKLTISEQQNSLIVVHYLLSTLVPLWHILLNAFDEPVPKSRLYSDCQWNHHYGNFSSKIIKILVQKIRASVRMGKPIENEILNLNTIREFIDFIIQNKMAVEEYGSEGRSSRLRSQTAAHKGPENKYRCLGIGLLLTEIGCMIAYGIQGKYFEEEFPSAISYISIISLIMLALFTIVGFGLLLSSYREGTWLGMASAIIVVAISLQLSPVLQTLWFQTFNTSFRDSPTPTEVGASVQYFWSYYYEGIVDASILKMRTSFLSCISILTLLTAVIGRISLSNLVQIVSIFQITWTLNYNLLIFMATSSRDFNPSEYHSPLVFDTFGSSFIYLFAGFFGITYSCLLGC